MYCVSQCFPHVKRNSGCQTAFIFWFKYVFFFQIHFVWCSAPHCSLQYPFTSFSSATHTHTHTLTHHPHVVFWFFFFISSFHNFILFSISVPYSVFHLCLHFPFIMFHTRLSPSTLLIRLSLSPCCLTNPEIHTHKNVCTSILVGTLIDMMHSLALCPHLKHHN